MLATLKSEFRLKQLGYRDCTARSFYISQWSENRLIYWFIRLIFLVYWLSWFLATMITFNKLSLWWIKLTNWGIIALLAYFIVAFCVTTHGLFVKQKLKAKAKICDLKTISGEVILENGEEENSDLSLSGAAKSDLRWFHILNWILFEACCGLAFTITITYWTLIEVSLDPFSWNAHLINSLLMIFDLFFNAIPVRIMHFYHLFFIALIYSLFSFFLYASGYETAIYPILDWDNKFNVALGITLGVTFIATPLIHFVLTFLLYRLKMYIRTKFLSRPYLVTSYPPRNTRGCSVTKEILQEENKDLSVLT